MAAVCFDFTRKWELIDFSERVCVFVCCCFVFKFNLFWTLYFFIFLVKPNIFPTRLWPERLIAREGLLFPFFP